MLLKNSLPFATFYFGDWKPSFYLCLILTWRLRIRFVCQVSLPTLSSGCRIQPHLIPSNKVFICSLQFKVCSDGILFVSLQYISKLAFSHVRNIGHVFHQGIFHLGNRICDRKSCDLSNAKTCFLSMSNTRTSRKGIITSDATFSAIAATAS